MQVPCSPVSVWLERHLQSLTLTEECEGYLYGRGASPQFIEDLGIREWSRSEEPCPEGRFSSKYGARGEALVGGVTIPIRAPTGRLIGVEVRSWKEKKIFEYRTPEACWNPFLLGAPQALEKMFAGGSVWVVEGVYDMSALSWAIPPRDALLSTLRAALPRSAVDFLARYCKGTVYMVYDNDATGRRATVGWLDSETGKPRLGALELLRRAGVRAENFPYRGKDPGEVWKTGGARAVRAEFNLVSL